MVVCRDLRESNFRKDSVVTVGTFDGVHIGHKKILESVVRIGTENNLRKVVVTFEPHPRIILNSHGEVKMLSSTEEKLLEFENSGIDIVYIIKFSKEFAATSAADFYINYLINKIGLSYLVIGYDHNFGKNREGSIDTIKKLSEDYGFQFKRVDAYKFKDETISSSLVRKNLLSGNVEKAANYLGKNYEFTGNVVYGNKRGRTMGFPTANLIPIDEHKLIPGNGVYKVKVFVNGCEHKGMMNIGTRPTIDKEEKIYLEVYILDFNDDIYGTNIKIIFENFIRKEQKFNSIEELTNQLNLDKQKILQWA